MATMNTAQMATQRAREISLVNEINDEIKDLAEKTQKGIDTLDISELKKALSAANIIIGKIDAFCKISIGHWTIGDKSASKLETKRLDIKELIKSIEAVITIK